MKHCIIFFVLIGILCIQSISGFANVTAEVNGKTLQFDVQPYISNNRTMVPIRAFLEAFESNFSWNHEKKEVTILKDDVVIVLKIGNVNCFVNGKPKSIGVAPILKQGRTFIPLRFIGETFGAKVNWDDKQRKVVVFYSKPLSIAKTNTGFLNIKTFNKQQLSQYNGKNGRPSYIAMEGLVYDISNMTYLQLLEHYGLDAGMDITEELNYLSAHGIELLKNPTVVGKYIGDFMGNL